MFRVPCIHQVYFSCHVDISFKNDQKSNFPLLLRSICFVHFIIQSWVCVWFKDLANSESSFIIDRSTDISMKLSLSLSLSWKTLLNYAILSSLSLSTLFITIANKIKDNILKLLMTSPMRPIKLNISKDEKGISQPSMQSQKKYEEILSPSPRKRNKEIFITKKPTIVEEAQQQIHDYIDLMDEKIQKYIGKHESQFLVAYRNHVKRTRQEMEEIRKRSMSNANTSASQVLRIEGLEKQLAIFREQSLKLFESQTKKEAKIQFLQKRVRDLEKEKTILLTDLKDLSKRNKYLEASMIKQNQAFEKKSEGINEFQFSSGASINLRPSTTIINNKKLLKSRNNYTQLQSQRIENRNINPLQNLNLKLDNLMMKVDRDVKESIKRQIEIFFNIKLATERNTFESRNESYKSVNFQKRMMSRMIKSQQQIQNVKKSQMEEYVRQCIETVRKQISRRKGIKTLNFFKEHSSITFEEFKKMDFFRLVQLLVSHEKVTKALYKALFQP